MIEKRGFCIAAFLLFTAMMAVTVTVSAAPPPVISGVNDRGALGDAHVFELYGSFPDAQFVQPVVSCGGERFPAEITATPLATQINVKVEAMPGGSTCTFSVVRLNDGVRSAEITKTVPAPPIQINAIADRGVTDGRRYVELYGTFESAGVTPASLQARVVCGGRYAGGRVEFASAAQINVSMPDHGAASGCSYVLRQPGSGLATPAFGARFDDLGSLPPTFGAYFYGGVPSQLAGSLPAGQAALRHAGFRSTRLVITPRMLSGRPADNYYNLNLAALKAACPAGTAFLSCVIRQPDYQAAISSPALSTIVLTAYDWTSTVSPSEYGDFLDPDFWRNPDNVKAVEREYADLTYALFQTQHKTQKTFVIASWEADNQAYCGSFYSYWKNIEFRAKCGDIDSRRAAISGLKSWFSARRAGIRAGRLRAAESGYAGIVVADAVEFNMNTLTYDKDYRLDGVVMPSVLRDVVPSIRPDYVLYSAYDSQYRGRMEQDLREIQGWLTTNAPDAKLAIGEVGFPRHSIDSVDTFGTVETVKAIQRVGLPIVILWEAYDTNAGDRVFPYGVLNENGRERKVMPILKRELSVQAAEIAANPSVKILGANDRGLAQVDGASYRIFELYGQFPNDVSAATALCDGVETPIDIEYRSTQQVNVRLSHQGLETRYCTFRIVLSDGRRSLAYGPVVD